MSLVNDIKTIQRAVGAEADGVFGPQSAAKVLEHLRRVEMVEDSSDGNMTSDGHKPPLKLLDDRTLETLATLDEKARWRFEEFAMLAKATAATFGCDYVAISGHRTWEEQDELFKKRPRVTWARGGESNHNFGIAADFAVFYGKVYADDKKPDLARAVHAACAVHAKPLGLEWGGHWKGKKADLPHYEVSTGLTLGEKRAKFKAEGSVL